MPFDSERWDTDGTHDPAASADCSVTSNRCRLIAQTGGKYYIFAHVFWQTHDSGSRGLRLQLNGTKVIADSIWPAAGPGGPETAMSIGTHYQLNAGDYVEAQAFQDSGGPLNVVFVDGRSPEFGMVKLP
jgi:hypothetical protein